MTLDEQMTAEWRDATLGASTRVAALVGDMTLREKIAQLYGVWVGADSSGGGVAPNQHEMDGEPVDVDALIEYGLGQLTRPFGTAPVDPVQGARAVAAIQKDIVAKSRHGIPAVVHEECLTGLAAWQATVFPAPLCWGASFDPDLVREMGEQIGESMRVLGIHQGLAPVLDVARDLRWGRVEETIGEDPLLIGLIGRAYVAGVQSRGIVATLKHFVGYSASRAGRNLAPVSVGPRELADVLLPPFELALRAGAGSVMNSYSDLDGVPVAADPAILTELLRGTYDFTGTVVSDYFSVAFLEKLHNVAADRGHAAALALSAGIDVELPTVNCYGEPLVDAVEKGLLDESVIDDAVTRVLVQKCELGLLDRDWSPESDAIRTASADLDPPAARDVARRLAERSLVLLRNDGSLPLRPSASLAVVGPRADEASSMMGCYSFPLHVGARHPDVPMGLDVATVLEALRASHDGEVTHTQGVPVVGGDDEGIAAAVVAAGDADVCVAVLGDLAGLFGRGTSGEGCDVPDLRLPGRQEELLDALLDTGTPVVLVLLVGRPYDITRQVDRLAGVLVGFFPGEEGAGAVAGVLTGRVNPSGRLPVGFPGAGSSQPASYLAPPLAAKNGVSTVDPSQLFPFGFGLSYASAQWASVRGTSGDTWPTGGETCLEVQLANPHDRETAEVVQVYLHQLAAEVALPVRRLVAVQRVDLAAGASATVTFRLSADLTSYTGRDGVRRVRPGDVELYVARSSADPGTAVPLRLDGAARAVGFERVMTADVSVARA